MMFHWQLTIEMEAQTLDDIWRLDCRGSDLNRHVGHIRLGEVRLGAKPDCLIGTELQATESAPEISVGCAVRQVSSKRVDVNGVTAVTELGVVIIHVGPYAMLIHLVDYIFGIWYEVYWTKDRPLRNTTINWETGCMPAIMCKKLSPVDHQNIQSSKVTAMINLKN